METPPGWYPDPEGSGAHRFWDGTAWAESPRGIAAPTSIEVTPTHPKTNPLASAFPPEGLVDGCAVTLAWNQPTRFLMTPGHHRVEVWHQWMLYQHAGRNAVEFDLAAGQMVTVQWRTPWAAQAKGKMSATDPSGASVRLPHD